MLGAIGSNLMSLLRLLTPSEVSKLTDEAVDRIGINSSEGVSVGLELNHGSKQQQDSFKDQTHEAKILPFNQVVDELPLQQGALEQQAVAAASKVSTKDKEEFLLRSLHIKKKRKKVSGGENFSDNYAEEEEEAAELKAKSIVEEVSSTIFLLQEKAKIRTSQLKLMKQEAVKSYRTQAAIDTAHEDKEDLTQSSSSGILINKRQF
ncbi:MAG: hypothetical protein ACOYL6_03835 [Bacteriovoracaceae bacterium]